MALTNNYISTVPQGNQQINNTQEPIKDNFQAIYDLIDINHVNFNTPDTFGRHKMVSYIQQSSDPSTTCSEMALYSKSVSNDTNNLELFYRYPCNGSVVQLTGLTDQPIPSNTSGAAQGGFWSSLAVYSQSDPVDCFWQYLSGGLMIMTYETNNFTVTTTSGSLTTNFPSGVGSSGVAAPRFTATPFVIQLATSTGFLSAGQTISIAAQLVDNTHAIINYSVNPNPPHSSYTLGTVRVTLIGM